MPRKRKPSDPPPMPLSARGQLARKASPWNKTAHCVGWKAARSHREYLEKGKQK